MAYLPNPGHLPDECRIVDEDGNDAGFRKVHVRLFGGFDSKLAGHAAWPAHGARPPTNWKIGRKPHPYEIREYEVV